MKKRWFYHKCMLRLKKHRNRKLQNAWNKYGEETFVFTVIHQVSQDQLTAAEQWWIDIIKPWFNLAPVAQSMHGYKHKPEAFVKMRKAQQNRRPMTEVERARHALINVGRKHTPEQIAKNIASTTGLKRKPLAPEVYARSSATKATNKARYLADPANATHICGQCGEKFAVWAQKQAARFCKKSCRTKWFNTRNNPIKYAKQRAGLRKQTDRAAYLVDPVNANRTCDRCGTPFGAWTSTMRFCGKLCRENKGSKPERSQRAQTSGSPVPE